MKKSDSDTVKKSDSTEEPPRKTSCGHSSSESSERPKRRKKFLDNKTTRPYARGQKKCGFLSVQVERKGDGGVVGVTAHIMESVQKSRHPFPRAIIPHFKQILDGLQEDGF